MDQKKLIQFLAFWAVNAIVLIVSRWLFRGNVVLGNNNVPASLAALSSGLILTVVNYLVPQALKKADIKVKNENLLGPIYLGVNTAVVWVLKRLAFFTGLGISSIFFVIITAIILTVSQWAVAQATGAMGKKS